VDRPDLQHFRGCDAEQGIGETGVETFKDNFVTGSGRLSEEDFTLDDFFVVRTHEPRKTSALASDDEQKETYSSDSAPSFSG